MKVIRKCLNCSTKLTGHFNKKRCEPCRAASVRNPKGSMTKAQVREAKRMAGTMPRDMIAAALNVSLSNLKRSCPENKFVYYYKYKRQPELVKKVCAYYEKNGKKKTQEKFKNEDVNIRSIVERYKIFEPLQKEWEDEQILELTRMAGLVSFENQAKFFKRPNAHAGSIKSAWGKKFKTSQKNINGMSYWRANKFVDKSAPFINTPFGTGGGNAKRILLWVDFEKHIKPEAPKFLKDSVSVMADFQRNLFKNKNVRREVLNMIKERVDS